MAFTAAPANAQTPAPIATAKSAPPPAALTGTLFTTREQRERLDRVRSRGGVAEDGAEASAAPQRAVINGFVKRSDGRNTVWVDDIMKRDPRIEVAEQLEPNMVGGNTAITKRAITTEKPTNKLNAGKKLEVRSAKRINKLVRKQKKTPRFYPGFRK